MPNRFWRDEIIQPGLNRDVDEAVAEQLEILAKDPSNAKAYFAMGTLLHFQGRPEQAIRQFQRSIELDSGNAAPHLSLGRIYAVQGDYKLAWKHARAAEALGARELVELLERYLKKS